MCMWYVTILTFSLSTTVPPQASPLTSLDPTCSEQGMSSQQQYGLPPSQQPLQTHTPPLPYVDRPPQQRGQLFKIYTVGQVVKHPRGQFFDSTILWVSQSSQVCQKLCDVIDGCCCTTCEVISSKVAMPCIKVLHIRLVTGVHVYKDVKSRRKSWNMKQPHKRLQTYPR